MTSALPKGFKHKKIEFHLFFFWKTQDYHGIINLLLAYQLFENTEIINRSEMSLLGGTATYEIHIFLNTSEVFKNKDCGGC